MISSYGQSGLSGAGFYNYQMQLSNLKLNLAMLNKPISQATASSWSKAAKSGLSSQASSFLKSYQSSMSTLKQKANALRGDNPTSAANALAVRSSDKSKVEATAKYRVTKPAQYEVNVKQLAKGQVNRSAGLEEGAASALSGKLTITSSKGAFYFDTTGLKGSTNREQLNSLAKSINSSRSGVTASVTVNEGKAQLELRSDQTGTGSAFTVAGSLSEQIGLNQVSQQAQNAEYSVEDKTQSGSSPMEFTSQTNQVTVGGYQISATLKDTGKATISASPDTEQTASALQDLVDSFNSTLKLLNDNAEMGPGVLNQMRRMVQPPASEKSMALIGITVKKDGQLSFDKATFTAAMNRNPSLVRDIVSGSHGVAQGMYNDASSGMNASSSSLIGYHTKSQQGQQQEMYLQNSSSFLSTYARSGSLNLMNYYAVGAFMSYNL